MSSSALSISLFQRTDHSKLATLRLNERFLLKLQSAEQQYVIEYDTTVTSVGYSVLKDCN